MEGRSPGQNNIHKDIHNHSRNNAELEEKYDTRDGGPRLVASVLLRHGAC